MTRSRSFILSLLLIAGLAAGITAWQLVRSPRSPPNLEAGFVCVEKGDFAGFREVERSLKQSGFEDEAIVLRSAWLAHEGFYEQALQLLPQRLAAGPLRRDVLRLVGECLFQQGNLQQAEVALTILASEFPDEVSAHRLLAVMYYDLGSNNLALKALSEIERLAPLDYRPHHLAGLIFSDAEDFTPAIEQFRLALGKNPAPEIESKIRLELAKALVQLHEYQQAIDVLAVTAASEDRSALLAECYWSLGYKTKASDLIQDVLTQSPSNPAALRVKVRLLEENNELDGAIGLLRKILATEPFDIESRYTLVQLLGLSGTIEERDREQLKYARFRALQDRLIELNLAASDKPDAVAPRRELVQVCRDLGRNELADMWQRALEFCEKRKQQREAGCTPSQ